MNYEKAVKNIRQELKTYIVKNKIKSLVLGVSGGIDSALCAVLAKPVCDELNIPLIGRSLPSNTNSSDENERAKKIGKLFCTDFKETSIKGAFNKISEIAYNNHEVFPADYPDGEDLGNQIPNGNIKARIRMILLYDLAGSNHGMVLSTDNYTEYLLGFWTLHGDVGDYGMIQNLWKTEVYDMADWICRYELYFHPELSWKEDFYGSLKECIKADATDGLGISNTDLDQILPDWKGSSRDGYAEVDKLLSLHLKMIKTDKESREEYIEKYNDPVLQRYLKTSFKRNNPFNIPRNKIDN